MMGTRKNPNYQPWHQFTAMICKECGEMYEPACEYPHKCRKQNSYPVAKAKEDTLSKALLFGALLSTHYALIKR